MNAKVITISPTIAYRIKNVVPVGEKQAQDVSVYDGKICTTEDIQRLDEQNITTIEGSGMMLLPGLVDLYSRCREPGMTRKGNIQSESMAAMSAGFTHVLCSPDTIPPVDSVPTVELIMHRSDQHAAGASIIPMAALTLGLEGEKLSELATLQAAGCKVASQADKPLSSTTVLYSAMQYAASFNMPLVLNARDAQLGIDGCAHTGAVATQLGLPTIPVAAETVALSRIIELCHETGCRVHISRISSARAVKHVSDAKQAGLPITCDVGIHHLFYCDDLLAGYDASFHSSVPFRGCADRQALRNGLHSGVIDAICSDHAPHDIDAALAPFPETEPGLSAYDWFTPLMLQIPTITDLTLADVVDKLHRAPLSIIGEPAPDYLHAGNPASFALLDVNAAFDAKNRQMISAGKNNPLTNHDAKALGLSELKGGIDWVFHENRLTHYR